ncbi:unnamed protein product [Kuraishia capsulata CBS 1993]|uniref:Alpha/beta hydrolase fold-3 domain-containing protein n=1 Tax=Kuraishia capsulata CBS 1993 TaxID=1382522 RepID=W6MX01_9ASCO|nr:uncharacterized protein KUCA_T00004026001 [Kuraishia capsulata CBS 1993]CDK28045.1 unnamed protein product [Kuraishia capsulata CBS 1993]
MVSALNIPPPINQMDEKFRIAIEPEYVELYDKYHVGRLAYYEVPIEIHRKDPLKHAIMYGKEIVKFDGYTEDLKIPVEGGEILVRYYRPRDALEDETPRPALVDFHGGGLVFGDIDSDDNYCKRVCRETGAVVFNVDYRLAPEFPYPVPLNDSWEALQHIVGNAEKYGIDKSKVAIVGSSSGGNLAAALAHRARDAGIKICYQILCVPVCDATAVTHDWTAVAEDCPYPSWKENYNSPDLSFQFMSWLYQYSLGNPRPAKYDSNPELNVVQSTNFKALASAIIFTAEYDILRDEAELYGKKLLENGVDCEVIRMAGAIHSFMDIDDFLETGKEYNRITIDRLKKAFA